MQLETLENIRRFKSRYIKLVECAKGGVTYVHHNMFLQRYSYCFSKIQEHL